MCISQGCCEHLVTFCIHWMFWGVLLALVETVTHGTGRNAQWEDRHLYCFTDK